MDWNAIAAVSGAASVVVALVAFAQQVRQLKRSIASATYQEIVKMFDDFSKLIIDRPELYEALYGDVDELEPSLRRQADWAAGIRLDWFESVAIQHALYGALPKSIVEHWMGLLAYELTKPALREHWQRHGHYYHPELQAQVARRVPALAAAAPVEPEAVPPAASRPS